MQIRYWNETAKQVDTQFFDFQFSRRPNPKNLFNCLITLLKDLPSEHLLQLECIYLKCLTMIVVKRIIQKLLIMALVAYMFSMMPLSLVLRLQIGF